MEMEALTAVSAAALTIYDMCKAVDRAMTISDIRLTHKRGGKSGEYTRPAGCWDRRRSPGSHRPGLRPPARRTRSRSPMRWAVCWPNRFMPAD